MKFTSQFIATITLCVLAAVLMVLVGAGISFYQMGSAYQQRQVDAVVRLVDEGWRAGTEQQDSIDRWLPALLDVNDIIDFSVLDGQRILYRYQAESRLSASELSLEYRRNLMAHPDLSVRLVLRPPFYDIDHSLAAVSGLTAAILLVFVGLLFSLRWFRRQLRGAELLDLRGQLILDGKLGLLQHNPQEEWPHHASQALDKLLRELKDAGKERSRFDTFIRANVFVDKKIRIGNRVFFDNRLDAALNDPASHSGALLLVELQDLEYINYNLGYERGDELLSSASVYLGHLIRRYPGALQARYTGNTFALLFPNLVESEALEAARQVMKLLQRLHWPDDIREPALFIGGVCFRYGEPLNQVEEEAELALRSAALQGGDGYFMYYKGVTEENSGKGTVRWRTLLGRQLEQDLIRLDRQGIYTGEQPEPVIHELLARIHDEQGRELSAGHFIPMAEKCGLLQELDRAIMLRCLTLLQEGDRRSTLAVNISAASLLNRGFHRWLIFELIQLPKSQLSELVIELSEAQVSRHFQALIKPLRALKALGCRLAVDHAGQDVVSTQYIRDYELDYLKLHPSLVRDIDHKPVNQMAVRSLVGNCAGGRTRVIAVGVETQAEWECLHQLGAYAGQGYYFARPERFELL
ncbi:RNase E specificity factor CsrD [Zobellella denitrificans]|jgi:RNase E specificity factor CsrD|uniref:Transcriptional regulator n=1 Tax=Zobellella denitrificans TaxID=347534 RepID=A0A231MWI6_9GAMM|nr:EAL domain-containing protein [Zobellella denitrificans]ATG75267.1 transcriptional regulator [Zobellella denitrificans]OXS14345.1 RNase E specificity factor CsrD [Zobellella denitrificans]